MRVFLILASITVTLIPLARAASCRAITTPSEIELPAGELVLADLLPTNACPTLLYAARHMRLGSAPLAGSPRVFTGDDIHALLQKLDDGRRLGTEYLTVPERVTVRTKDRQESGASAHFVKLGVSRPAARSLASHSRAASGTSADEAVRPGQTVMLLWDQNGIRLQVPALCLDRGSLGSQIRARILHGGTVIRAIVMNAGSLRAIS